MMDSSSLSESISDLVNQFLDLSRSPEMETSDSVGSHLGLMYELDSLVSNFLDQNQLSADQFNAIEQQVLNSLAEDVILEADVESGSFELAMNDQGNYDADAVLTALDLYNLDAPIDSTLDSADVNVPDIS